MTCRETIDLLADYAGGALGARAQTTFDAHLAGCPACVEYVQSYDEAIRLARDAWTPSDDAGSRLPADLVEAILTASSRRGH